MACPAADASRLDKEVQQLRGPSGSGDLRLVDVAKRDDGSATLTVEVPVAGDLTLEAPWRFRIEVPRGYPQCPPRCYRAGKGPAVAAAPLTQAAAAPSPTAGEPPRPAGGVGGGAEAEELLLQITEDNTMGWSSIYTLAACAHAVRNLFRRDAPPPRRVVLPAARGGTAAAVAAPAPWHLPSLRSGMSCLQGRRRSMEDVALIDGGFCEGLSLFCIFDGHGGRECADFCAAVLPAALRAELQRGGAGDAGGAKDAGGAIRRALLEVDRRYLARLESAGLCGSTALVALVDSAGAVHVGNVGDCRGVVGCAGGTAVALTRDARAERPDEVARIVDRGGFIVSGRVCGQLAISRALGDKDLKSNGQNFISAEAELSRLDSTGGCGFLLLACDGLWDVMSNQGAVDFVNRSLRDGRSPQQACDALVRHAVEDLKTRDNVSVIIVVPGPSPPPPHGDAAGAGGSRLLKPVAAQPDGVARNPEAPTARRAEGNVDDEELMRFLMDDANFT